MNAVYEASTRAVLSGFLQGGVIEETESNRLFTPPSATLQANSLARSITKCCIVVFIFLKIICLLTFVIISYDVFMSSLSRAIYGVDVMFDLSGATSDPVVLEVNYSPDCRRV